MGQTVSARLFTACEAGASHLATPAPSPPPRPIIPRIMLQHTLNRLLIFPPPALHPGEVQTVTEILDSGVSVDGQWTDGSTGLHVSDAVDLITHHALRNVESVGVSCDVTAPQRLLCPLAYQTTACQESFRSLSHIKLTPNLSLSPSLPDRMHTPPPPPCALPPGQRSQRQVL